PVQDADEYEMAPPTTWVIGATDEWEKPAFAEKAPTWQLAVRRARASALPILEDSSVAVSAMPGYGSSRWPDVSASLIVFGFVGNGAQRSGELLAASRGGSISFDPSTGQLAIRPDPGDHTVREALAADGFLEVTLDGQRHSSNPRSTSFDSALAGASGATVAGIRYDGGVQDTLMLGSQRLAGGLTVHAAGATVVTEAVDTAGPLTIQAPNITVRA